MTGFSSSRTAAHSAFPCFPAPEQLMHTQAQKGGAPTISTVLPSLSPPPARSLSEKFPCAVGRTQPQLQTLGSLALTPS